MEEINKHSFKEALKKIDIARRPTVAILPKYQEKAFYIFDKSITAKDMNTFVAELQDKLLDSNIAIETSLNEIKGIYEALEKLDDDYIEGILVSLKKANDATEENTQTIQALKLTVDEFCSLRESVKSQETEFAQLNEIVEIKADKSDLSIYAKKDVVYTKEEVGKMFKNLWIAYGITTATLLAGLIASFLI